MTWAVVSLDVDGPLLDPVVELYCRVFDGPGSIADRAEAVRSTFVEHASYDGFRGFVAVSDDASVLGFAYGYDSASGQYWHDHLAASMGAELTDRWLSDCFEVAELAVAPHVRRRGLGGVLHDALLAGVPRRTSVLTTGVENVPARSLYARRGWRLVYEPLDSPSPAGAEIVVLGLEGNAFPESPVTDTDGRRSGR